MKTLIDKEFGEITLHEIKHARQVKVGVAPNGRLKVTMPKRTPLFVAKSLISTSRPAIRKLLERHTPSEDYQNGDRIGKSHSLFFKEGSKLGIKFYRNQIIVTKPEEMPVEATDLQRSIRDVVIKALRKEAKEYLTKRLEVLADELGYSYERVRFSHASSRWGSCSSSGTISLNIALMKLPYELIDYVLIHELCHTAEMNHSVKFWNRVAIGDPDYKSHRKLLKEHTPTI